jgi:hypothetical protein
VGDKQVWSSHERFPPALETRTVGPSPLSFFVCPFGAQEAARIRAKLPTVVHGRPFDQTDSPIDHSLAIRGPRFRITALPISSRAGP